MSEKQKPHVDQLEEDDEFEEFDQVRFFQAVLRIHEIYPDLAIFVSDLRDVNNICIFLCFFAYYFLTGTFTSF